MRGVVLPGVASLSDADRADGVAFVARAQIDAATPGAAVDVDPERPRLHHLHVGFDRHDRRASSTRTPARSPTRAQPSATYELDADDRLANIAPLHFDQSTFELYAAPLAGAMPCSSCPTRCCGSRRACQRPDRSRTDHGLVLGAVRARPARRPAARSTTATSPSLRWVLFGGESFPPAALAALMRAAAARPVLERVRTGRGQPVHRHHLDDTDRPVPIPIGRRVARRRRIRVARPRRSSSTRSTGRSASVGVICCVEHRHDDERLLEPP